MKKSKFIRLPDYEDEDDFMDLEIGDYFLMGRSVCGQKESKKHGDSISYYEVIGKSNIGIEYAPVFDYLDDDVTKGEE
jgi:hypothetical protein